MGVIGLVILGGIKSIQIYGNFEGFPLYQCIVWVGNIIAPAKEDAYFVMFCLRSLKGSHVTQKGKIMGNTKALHISNHIQDMKC